MSKFDNAKVGDKVFSTVYGWGVIILVSQLDQEFPIIVEFDTGKRKNYRDDGKNFFSEKYPNLYWNEVKLPTEKEDKKPFDLVEFLRENLSKQEFINERINYCLFKSDIWCCDTIDKLYPGVVYLQGTFKGVIDILNQNNISVEQLVEAYKELGWL